MKAFADEIFKVASSFTEQQNFRLVQIKGFEDDKNVTKNFKFVLIKVENIVGKGENAGYQHFLIIPQCFANSSSTGLLKVVIVWKWG